MSKATKKAGRTAGNKPSKKKPPDPTGVDDIDRLAGLSPCAIQDYVRGVSAYIRGVSTLAAGPKKASQIRLSNALARVLANELGAHVPRLKGNLVTDEQKVAGGLRTANADVSESHYLDGLRLAVELKPINLAVGRAIWNRFGDVRGDSRYNRPCFGLSLSWVRKNRHDLTRLCHPKSVSSRTLRPTCRGSQGTRG